MKIHRLHLLVLVAFLFTFLLAFSYFNVNAEETYIKRITETKSGIKITWKKVNVKKYQLYRSEKKNKGFKSIATITQSTKNNWIDTKTKPNTVYYYKIKCYQDKKTSESSKTVKFKTPTAKPRINFEKHLKKVIKKHVDGHYPCNVLVNKYIKLSSSLSSNKKAVRARQFTNVDVSGSPVANSWKHGTTQLSYKYTTVKKNYSKTGKVTSTTYPLKSSGKKYVASQYETNMDNLTKGDIITYSRGGRATHVAIYIGKFKNKSSLISYLNNEVGIKCNMNTRWIKSWNGKCKHWVLQGGMGYNNQVYICNNANTTGSGSTLSHRITLFENE